MIYISYLKVTEEMMDTAQDLRSQAMAAMSEGIHSSTRTAESYSACINLYMEAHQYYCINVSTILD